MKLKDLSQTISDGIPVFPGENPPSIICDILPADASYVTHRLETNMHTGTHIDGPFHTKSGTLTMDKYPIDLFSAKAIVIDVRGLPYIRMRPEWSELFSLFKAILFCTSHSQTWKTDVYYNKHPEFDPEIAANMKKHGVRLAGFDSPSPDKEPFPFHSIFLNGERFLIENLTNLDVLLDKKDVTFMAFPLKIEAEASLIRAVALVED